MRENATYTRMLPIIEIHDGMAFLTVNKKGHQVCTNMHNFQTFLELANRKVADWHAQQGQVVPFPDRRDN